MAEKSRINGTTRRRINVSFCREYWKQREIRGSASVTERRKRKAPVAPGAQPESS